MCIQNLLGLATAPRNSDDSGQHMQGRPTWACFLKDPDSMPFPYIEAKLDLEAC